MITHSEIAEALKDGKSILLSNESAKKLFGHLKEPCETLNKIIEHYYGSYYVVVRTDERPNRVEDGFIIVSKMRNKFEQEIIK